MNCQRSSGVLSCACGAQWTLPASSLGGIERLSKAFLDAHQECVVTLRANERGDEMTWYDDLMADAEECRRKAREAKTPNTAKRWYEAAEAAARAARAAFPQPAPINVQPVEVQAPSVGPYQPVRCTICGRPASVCPGHNWSAATAINS